MPVPTPCLLPTLIDKISAMRPSKELAASFEAILTSPDNCGRHIIPALQWARAFDADNSALPKKNGDLIQLLSVPLLVWGLRQPWADTVSATHVVNFWFKYQERNTQVQTQEKALEQTWATHAVRLCAQDPNANRARAEDFCRVWVNKMDATHALWEWSSIYSQNLDQVYNGWLDMGRLALPDLRDLARPQNTLQQNWRARMTAVFTKMPVPAQSDFLMLLLTSDIPDPLKVELAKRASSLSWLDPNVHEVLRPMMPAQDHACYPELPWTKHVSHLKVQDVIHANQSLANLYCPTLQPAFNLMLHQDDWTNREAVCRVAHAGRLRNKPSQELPIGDLVGLS